MCKDSCKLKCCTDVAHTSNNNRIMKKVVWKFLGCFFFDFVIYLFPVDITDSGKMAGDFNVHK